MTGDLLIVSVLLLLAAVMFVRNTPRMDVVAVIMMTVLPVTGIIDVSDALAGLSDPNVVLIATLFIVGEALVRTGVTHRLGDWLLARAGAEEGRLLPRMMGVVSTIGAVMSSTAVVALFIPVALRIARKTGIGAGRLMMPLSIAALISGMMTLVATPPNLVVNGELARRGFDGFGFFSFTPFGLAVLGASTVYILLIRRFLPTRRPGDAAGGRPRLAQWIAEYALGGRAYRLQVTPHSPWVGKALEQLDLRGSAGINIVGLERASRLVTQTISVNAATVLRSDDVLLIDMPGRAQDLEKLASEARLHVLSLADAYFQANTQEVGMAEVVVPAASRLVGQTVVEARFRSAFGLSVIGLKRGSAAHTGDLLAERLRVGDTLLVVGPWRAIRKLNELSRKHLLVLNLPAEMDDSVVDASRAPYAVAILGLMIAGMVSGIVPNVIAALGACLLFGLFRCIDISDAYRSIHWQTIILIVGMMPFAIALQKTGGIDLAAGALLAGLRDYGIHAVLAALFAITAVVGLFISNTATAILMAPVALAVAEGMGASPYPFAMTVALAASAAFMTPVSSPVNTLVVGPGDYRFFDFVRIGVPLSLITLLLTVVLVPVILPP